METRSQKLFLINHDESHPRTNSKRLFYNMRKVNLLLRPSANLVIKEVEVFLEKVRIPTKQSQHSIEKL